jgi:hypothetical protein
MGFAAGACKQTPAHPTSCEASLTGHLQQHAQEHAGTYPNIPWRGMLYVMRQYPLKPEMPHPTPLPTRTATNTHATQTHTLWHTTRSQPVAQPSSTQHKGHTNTGTHQRSAGPSAFGPLSHDQQSQRHCRPATAPDNTQPHCACAAAPHITLGLLVIVLLRPGAAASAVQRVEYGSNTTRHSLRSTSGEQQRVGGMLQRDGGDTKHCTPLGA